MDEIRWTDKVYLDNQSNIRSSNGCPTDLLAQDIINNIKIRYQYHLSCPVCNKTWWEDTAFPVYCPYCNTNRLPASLNKIDRKDFSSK